MKRHMMKMVSRLKMVGQWQHTLTDDGVCGLPDWTQVYSNVNWTLQLTPEPICYQSSSSLLLQHVKFFWVLSSLLSSHGHQQCILWFHLHPGTLNLPLIDNDCNWNLSNISLHWNLHECSLILVRLSALILWSELTEVTLLDSFQVGATAIDDNNCTYAKALSIRPARCHNVIYRLV